MADARTNAGTTQLVRYAAQAEPLRRIVKVTHDPSFVTQLLAGAADLTNMPQRRRSDRAGPLAAYASSHPPSGRTRRIA